MFNQNIFPSLKALIIFWNTHPSVKNLQEGLTVGTPHGSPLWISCYPLQLADKRASRVAIVILSCWALHNLEGNQMRTRSGEQYCECQATEGDRHYYIWSCLGLLSQDAGQCTPSTHHGPNLMFGYLNIEFFYDVCKLPAILTFYFKRLKQLTFHGQHPNCSLLLFSS